MKRLRFAILGLLLLGCAGLAAHYAAIPYPVTVPIAELDVDSDGILVGDLLVDWPLKVKKDAWDKIVVELPDGTRVERVDSNEIVKMTSGNAFAVYREAILFRIEPEVRSASDAFVRVTLPVKLRDFLHKISFSAAAILFLLAWIGPGLRATLLPPTWMGAGLAALAFGIPVGGLLWLPVATKASVWLALGMIVVGPLVAVALFLRVEEKSKQKQTRTREPIIKVALVLVTVFVSCALFEVAFDVMAEDFEEAVESTQEAGGDGEKTWFQLPADLVRLAMIRNDALTMPEAWRRRDIELEGASLAYEWHEVLHVHDQDGFRRLNGTFPPKDPGTYRIMVIGDSKTYGYGIDERWTFSRILESSLAPDYEVEVFNLGRSGYQSADILNVLRKHLPRLDPDLVIYGVCLNDFLPSRISSYDRYAVPLPEAWKVFLNKHTYLAKLASDAYDKALLALDLKVDFLDDILAGKKAYQSRFAQDVASMSHLVEQSGLPPVLGFVFHHWAAGNPRGWNLVGVAETAMSDAGFDVVSVKDWREKYEGYNFAVSRWEGHPNELAHSLVAERLYNRLKERGYLLNHRLQK